MSACHLLLSRIRLVDIVRLDVFAVVSPPLGLVITVVTLQYKAAVLAQHVSAEVASVTGSVVTLTTGPPHTFMH